MASLYDITGRALMLLEMADEDGIEEEVLKDTFEAIEGEYDAKIESYCKVLKNIEADVSAIDNEISRLSQKKKVLANNIDRMKRVMFQSLKAMGKTKAGGTILTASIQKNGGKAPLVVDEVEPETLPEEFRKTTYSADNAAIREALEAGRELSFARLGERGESLRIK